MPVHSENEYRGMHKCGGYAYDTVSGDRLCTGNLESTGHKILKYPPRIVSRCDSFHLVHVLWTIAAKWILRGVCVVEISIILAQTSFGGISVDLLNGGCTYFLEYLIILRIIPR